MKLNRVLGEYTGVHARNMFFLFSFYLFSHGLERGKGVTIITGLVIFSVLFFLNAPLYYQIFKYGLKGLLILLSLLCSSIFIVILVLNRSFLGLDYSSIFNLVFIIIIFFGFILPKLLLLNSESEKLLAIINRQIEE